MSDMSKRTKHLGVKVSDAKYNEIVYFADEKGISISALLVLAVSEYIKANKNNYVYGGNVHGNQV